MNDAKETIEGLDDDSDKVTFKWTESSHEARVIDQEIIDRHQKILEECNLWITMNTTPDAKPQMVWIDIETTGLDYNNDLFLELGLVVTDAHGKVLPGGVFQSIIHAPGGVDWENKSTPFVTDMHNKSRLAYEIEATFPETHSIEMVEQKAIAFLKSHFGEDMADLKLPVAGSSVDFDKRWLEGRMPELRSLFGHRVIDVSSFRLVYQLLNGDHTARADNWRGYTAHRVIPDIIDTIGEYLFYTTQD